MAKHLWLQHRLEPATVNRGLDAMRFVLTREPNVELARLCRFVGYYLERERQGIACQFQYYEVAAATREVGGLWTGATASKHRYARGKNGQNYERVGRMVVCALASHGLGMKESRPPEMAAVAWDWLQEHPEGLQELPDKPPPALRWWDKMSIMLANGKRDHKLLRDGAITLEWHQAREQAAQLAEQTYGAAWLEVYSCKSSSMANARLSRERWLWQKHQRAIRAVQVMASREA